MIMQENRPEMNRYLRMQELSTERCGTSCVKIWILGFLKMRKITKEAKENNIRKYFTIMQTRK